MNEHNFRLYRKSDYQQVIKLWLDSGLILSLSDVKNELQILADHEDTKFFILEIENEIRGTAICAFDGRRGYIHHVAVDPKYQGKGFGKLLMNHAMEYYQYLKTVKVHIMIERSNQGVIEFYKNLGWNIREDLFLMTKTLRGEEFSLDE